VLEKAGVDLRSARADLATDPPIAADALFHCQQAVEKALKAFLTWHDRPFRKTHDLVELGGQCVALDPALDNRLRTAALLTEYAWKFRYPGEARDAARADVFDYIERFYNPIRRHSTLGNLSPIAFERAAVA
jgi:HEPN domain-containing protein